MRSGSSFGLALAGACLLVSSCSDSTTLSARDVNAEVERMSAAAVLWPGFEPLEIPLAIYDGARTYLFRHPNPPGDFYESRGADVLDGRHPAMTANSSAEIESVMTATLILDPDRFPIRTEVAALAVHEMFHVFQRTQHPSWSGNEVDLFTYPTDNPDLLALRRLETEALRRALLAKDVEEAGCWVRQGLIARHERFARMGPDYSTYERATELNEGLATYVEHHAAQRTQPELPVEGFAADNVRDRAYQTGLALALALDRFHPQWRDELERDDARSLDQLLADVLDPSSVDRVCAWTDEEREHAQTSAKAATVLLVEGRGRLRHDFEHKPGWSLIVEASPGAPLWPNGFDPLNVKRVEGGLLHTRFIKLGNETGSLEVLGDTVLTEAAGDHPLFDGVRRLVLPGLADAPIVSEHEGQVTLDSPTFTAEFGGAVVERAEEQVMIRLSPH